jgi:uncharacterized repeat protein (TIGR03803 family)
MRSFGQRTACETMEIMHIMADMRGKQIQPINQIPPLGFRRLRIGLASFAVLTMICPLRAEILFTDLVSFDGTNAGLPEMVIQAPDGNFYGTVLDGGGSGNGAVFRFTPEGALTFITAFDGTNGAKPLTLQVVPGSSGRFYGTTYQGGINNYGTVFELTSSGTLTTLVSFTGTNGAYPGAHPHGGLALGTNGDLYGVTSEGGSNNLGTIFKLTAGGDFTNLVSFDGTNGACSQGRLLLAADGGFYGTTVEGGTNGLNDGTIFRMASDGTLTTLLCFDGTNGAGPAGGLTLGRDGNFYGTTIGGGISNMGSIFRWSPSGEFSNLGWFQGTNGRAPYGELTETSDGNFYGTTSGGGADDHGTVFRITLDGVLTTIVSFTNSLGPTENLAIASDGDFYGATLDGGIYRKGGIFRLSVPLPPFFENVALSNAGVVLTWSAVAGQSYQLQSATALSPGAWTEVGGMLDATNGSLTVLVPMDQSVPRFYRVVIP